MSTWQQRGDYLVSIAQHCLQGHSHFDLCRSHLVKASQISRGTIYNHFPCEADLKLAVITAELSHQLAQTKLVEAHFTDSLHQFLYHHCNRLHEVVCKRRFSYVRDLPDEAMLEQASEQYRNTYLRVEQQYSRWNSQCVDAIGIVPGFDRKALVKSYIRGCMIEALDNVHQCGNIMLYQQFSFAVAQLLGHSDKRLPAGQAMLDWFDSQ
ncbi:TetR/AcrR family transcriptional regulator [Ferrimonas lipolytica]|uniref:TetR/AcrR family transcriptional regulator n=2 Tax=Ferrimonas lipolytica TaxID=2724191 RepID=A0A6H1UJC6_9GAMM|nr:TetR/AcrR family transcriptional regulator [Ferrimonas lipolytica]